MFLSLFYKEWMDVTLYALLFRKIQTLTPLCHLGTPLCRVPLSVLITLMKPDSEWTTLWPFSVSPAVFQSSAPHPGSPGSPTERGLPMVRLLSIVQLSRERLSTQGDSSNQFAVICCLDLWARRCFVKIVFMILEKTVLGVQQDPQRAAFISEWHWCSGVARQKFTFSSFVTVIPAGHGARATSPPSITPGATGKSPNQGPGPWLDRVTIWGETWWPNQWGAQSDLTMVWMFFCAYVSGRLQPRCWSCTQKRK